MLRDPTIFLQNKITELKTKLQTAIDLSQKNLSAFQKFKLCSQEIQATTSLDDLPGLLESLRSRLRLRHICVILAEEEYAGYVPLSVKTAPLATLHALMAEMHVSCPNVSPMMDAVAVIRQSCPSLRALFPQCWESDHDGSLCVFFLNNKYHPEEIIGLLCLEDSNPNRFEADMATDFIEFFADSFAWTLVTLREHEKLLRENTQDHLTGCFNRTYLNTHAPRILEFSQRKGFPVALLFIDLDKFKSINDNHGHACGDRVLIAIAEKIRNMVRDYDFFVRLGGDEFVVLLPDVDRQTALATAQRIQKAVRGVQVADICNRKSTLKTSASVGVAMYEQGDTLEGFINRADQAMYDVKKKRR